MKVYKIVAIAVVLAATGLVIVFGIPANFLVGAVQARVEAQTGYRLRISGGTSIGLWPSPTVLFRGIKLVDGNGADPDVQFQADSARIAVSLADLLKGHTRITELTIAHPMLHLSLQRQRAARTAPPAAASTDTPNDTPTIDRIVVADGTVGLYSGSRLESSINRIDLEASLGLADVPSSVTGSFAWDSQMFQVALKAKALPQHLQDATIPVEVTLQAPGLLEQPLSAKAELRTRTGALAVNALSGRLGQSSAFNGWAAVDFRARKPMLQGDLDFNRLHILTASDNGNAARQNALNQPWSDRDVNLEGLNFFDAELRLSASEFTLGSFHFAPIAIEATLDKGVVQAKLQHAGLYGGEANGTISLDASGPVPVHAMQLRLDAVNALPLLSDVANFESLEGTLQAGIDVNATGASQHAAISTLAGAVTLQLANGAVRGIDLAKLMHNLTNTILNGWQQDASDKTPLSDLNAHFRLAKGVATTDDLDLSGPVVQMTGAGNIDIGAKTLQLKVNPQLVVGTQGTSDSSQAKGLGVPVVIQGSWSEPRIYPDVAGILDNPNGVSEQLKSVGKGLFGDSNGSNNNTMGSSTNGTLDNLIQGLGGMFNTPAGNRK